MRTRSFPIGPVLPAFSSLPSLVSREFTLGPKLNFDGKFLLFPKLPRDVQIMIWEKYLEMDVPVLSGGWRSIFQSLIKKRHPLSLACKTSRWVLEHSGEFRGTTQTYFRGEGKQAHDVRYAFIPPKSVFVFECLLDLHTGLCHGGYNDGSSYECKLNRRLLISTAARVIVVKEMFEEEVDNTARLDEGFQGGGQPTPRQQFASYGLYATRNALLHFPYLERLILVKPLWVDSTEKSSQFKLDVAQKVETLKRELESALVYNDMVACCNSLNRSRAIVVGEGRRLTISSWWRAPKVEIISQAEWDSTFGSKKND